MLPQKGWVEAILKPKSPHEGLPLLLRLFAIRLIPSFRFEEIK
jgi:hypothetical protein